ncbi:MAG: hypothetical protein U0K68_13165 [Agathobacter sp.]|nr:hypothetical protein [Agathobacter sp.]
MNSVHITKVCDANFSPADYNGKSYSSLGKFVVAKLKVYSYDDGMTEDGEIEYNGPTYYAIIPESYLGDNVFCGMGYWDLCSFDYVKPMVVLADSPDGKYSEEEEKQVIQILASFRLS